MALELVTGYQGKDHVTAEQWADFNRGIYGDAAILPVGSKMAVEIQTANQITVKDGLGVFDGREVYIGYGESENIAIQSGTQAMLRNDIVVVEYTKEEETGVESVALKVIAGTPAASAPKDPAYENMDIRTGVFKSQKPFCRVRLNGTAIEGIDMLAGVKEIKGHAFEDTVKDYVVTEQGHVPDAMLVKKNREEITQLNSNLNASNFTLTNSTYYPTTNVIVSGRVMQLQCAGLILKDVPANSEFVIGTLPAAYRPSYKIIKYVLGGSTTSRLFRISIDVDGKVTYTPTADIATGVGVNINETFVAKPS